jgi:hypothetical protein
MLLAFLRGARHANCAHMPRASRALLLIVGTPCAKVFASVRKVPLAALPAPLRLVTGAAFAAVALKRPMLARIDAIRADVGKCSARDISLWFQGRSSQRARCDVPYLTTTAGMGRMEASSAIVSGIMPSTRSATISRKPVATSTVGGFPSPQPLTLTCGGSLDWRAVATQLLSSAKRRRGGQRPFLSFVAPGRLVNPISCGRLEPPSPNTSPKISPISPVGATAFCVPHTHLIAWPRELPPAAGMPFAP